MKKLSLNGTWKLTSQFQNLNTTGTVPGSVYGDLLSHKLIPDPFDQDNEYYIRDIMNDDFRYSRSFEVDNLSDFVHSVLVCEGIDTLSEIYINNRLLSPTDNMHRTWRFDINEFLVLGMNTIEVLLKSPLKYITEKYNACPYRLYQSRDAVKGYTFLRKGSSMFGWDWGPQLPDAGIWRDIYIEFYEVARISNQLIIQNHHDDVVELDIHIETEKYVSTDNLFIEVAIADDSGQIIELKYEKITNQADVHVFINNPHKWYPVGYGAQPLYQLKTKLIHSEQIVDEKNMKFGLRKVFVLRENDQYGQSFTFVINGIKIFGKGSDYIPEDNLLSRTNEALTRKLLSYAVSANHNMVRVWGGGIYPDDYFFDICDELGLMVWQDLMFACSVYDMNDREWVETMKAEIIDNLIRIRNHPSIALICGNNENETAIEFWNVPSQELSKQFYLEQYETIIRPLVNQHFPQIDYWPSSPSSGTTFENSNSDHYGDMHYWGVWHNNEPISYYRKYFPRFMSEFGIQSFPSLRTVKTFAREEDLNIFSYIMEKHQKNNTANDKILNYIGKMFRYPKDFDSLLYVSQLIQAEGVRYGVEHWRRNYGQCMGALYWQLNDCWPVASWSSIDYYHRWKALHYHSKKFYQPVLVSICEEGNQADIYLTNDTLSDVSGKLKYQLMDFNGKIIDASEMIVTIKRQSAEKFYHLSLKLDRYQAMETVLYASFMFLDNIVSDNQVSFVPDKHLKLKKPQITKQLRQNGNHYSLQLKSDTYAKYVEITLDKEDIIFSDNYFFLIPNQTKTIEFVSDLPLEEVSDSMNIRSLVDTY